MYVTIQRKGKDGGRKRRTEEEKGAVPLMRTAILGFNAQRPCPEKVASNLDQYASCIFYNPFRESISRSHLMPGNALERQRRSN